jgi:hypothetical protein
MRIPRELLSRPACEFATARLHKNIDASAGDSVNARAMNSSAHRDTVGGAAQAHAHRFRR